MSKITLAPNASGTGTLSIASPSTNSDYTLTLPAETGTVLTSASSITQNAGPAFSAVQTPPVSVPNATFTKIQYTSEEFDTNSCYDAANSRFTPNVAGYYQISASMNYGGATLGGNNSLLAVFKNGSWAKSSSGGSISYYNLSALVYMNGSTDYLEIYAYQSTGSTISTSASGAYQFAAVLVRAA